jgi:hypothetical protein
VVTLFATRSSNQNPPILSAQFEISNNNGVSFVPQTASDSIYTISGALTNLTLQFVSLFPTTGRQFRIRYTTCLGANFSAVSKLTVTCTSSQIPVITSSPESASVVEGSVASLSAESTDFRNGAPNLEVRWEFSSDLGRTWNLVSHSSFPVATNVTVNAQLNRTTLSFSPLLSMNGFRFRAGFKNCWTSWAISQVSVLSVSCNSAQCPPSIVTHPTFQTLRVNGIAIFNSAAVAVPNVTSFFWEITTNNGVSWVPIAQVANVSLSYSGSVSNTTVSFSAPPSFDGYAVRVTFVNAIGNSTSLTAFMAVRCVDYGCGINEDVCSGPEDCGPTETGCGCKCSACPSCLQVPNPVFDKQCSANIVLILDESGSIGPYVSNVRSGINQFLLSFAQTSLVGGVANIGLVEFSGSAALVTAGGNAGRMVRRCLSNILFVFCLFVFFSRLL